MAAQVVELINNHLTSVILNGCTTCGAADTSMIKLQKLCCLCLQAAARVTAGSMGEIIPWGAGSNVFHYNLSPYPVEGSKEWVGKEGAGLHLRPAVAV